MSLKPEVLDRLLLSKSFLEKIRVQPAAAHDRHTLAANIIAAHDAAELAIAGVCDQLDCLPQKGVSYLMNYFESYRTARGSYPFAREYFRNLNDTRNLLKHQGLFPDSRQWARVGEIVFQHITKWCWDDLNESFSDLDESALLLDADVKRLYDEARQSRAQGDYKTTLEKLGMALSIVFENNAALRGFEAGSSNTEDALRVVGFGIHGNDFLALQQFLPHIWRWGANANTPQWKQSAYGHPGNWREESVSFCLKTFVDVAVKLQGARWIPGPLSRDVLYDHQVEALKDNVEFWRDVPDEAPPRDPLKPLFFGLIGNTKTETQHLLPHKGDKLRAVVSLATKLVGVAGGVVSGSNKDETVLSVMLKNFDSWHVHASDVKVTCVPKDVDVVKQYYAWLPEFEWDPE